MLQVRYAAVMTSLNSMAVNLPTELIAVAVEKNYWFPAQGLAYAFQIQEEKKRAVAIEKLCKYLTSELFLEALPEQIWKGTV